MPVCGSRSACHPVHQGVELSLATNPAGQPCSQPAACHSHDASCLHPAIEKEKVTSEHSSQCLSRDQALKMAGVDSTEAGNGCALASEQSEPGPASPGRILTCLPPLMPLRELNTRQESPSTQFTLSKTNSTSTLASCSLLQPTLITTNIGSASQHGKGMKSLPTPPMFLEYCCSDSYRDSFSVPTGSPNFLTLAMMPS